MTRYRVTIMRTAMIAIVAVMFLKSSTIPKAEAIADPNTSSGDACFFSCTPAVIECVNQTVGPISGCADFGQYCESYCSWSGSPFTSWWLF